MEYLLISFICLQIIIIFRRMAASGMTTGKHSFIMSGDFLWGGGHLAIMAVIIPSIPGLLHPVFVLAAILSVWLVRLTLGARDNYP